MTENYYYVLNAGKTHSQALNYTYANRGNAFPSVAFNKTSVNPIIKNPGIPSSGFASTSNNSANFFEIRNAPVDVGGTTEPQISANIDNAIVNRLIPTGVNVTTYAQNKQETKSNRIRTYNPTHATTGYRLAGTEKPANFLIDEYDYFILINPEVTGNDGTVSIRPHFAKITEIIAFDEFGDGIEIEPKYPTSIPNGTNYEIYKGPAKTNTNVVAVSYGLRGSTSSSSSIITDKYDVSNVVSRPTWYFYEDRLVNKNQLNYDTKYMLTSCRWWSDWTSFGGTGTQASSGTYHSSTTISASVLNNAQYQGHSIWTDISGVKHYIGNLVTQHASAPVLDDIKYNLPTSGTSATLYYGRTMHQSVFMTESEFGTIISDLGASNFDAVLVDVIEGKDVSKNYYDTNDSFTFDPTKWSLAFPNYRRSTVDKNNDHADFNATGSYAKTHGNLQGPKRHIYYKDSHLRNNVIYGALDVRVNLPKNKITQMASIKILDQTGLSHLKYKENQKLVIRNAIYSGVLGEYQLPFTATTVPASNTIILNQIKETFDCRNNDFIKVGDILRMDDDLFIVSSIGVPDNTNLQQILTVNKTKTLTGKTFTNIGTLPSHAEQPIYIRAFNGSLAGSLPIDTEVVHTSNNYSRLTMDGNTINKKNTALANTKLRILAPEYFGKDIDIDYGDSVHSYIKLKTPISSDYVPNPTIPFLYYVNAQFSIDDEIFSGNVEDITSTNENGIVTYTITGRDKLSKLLDNVTSKNLNHSNDIIHSTLTPTFDNYDIIPVSLSLGATTFTANTNPANTNKYDLLYNQNWLLIGEVLSISGATVTLKEGAYVSATQVRVINVTSNKSHISLNKALFTNLKASSYPTDLSGAGDKGLIFLDGEQLNYDTSRNQTLTALPYTSATGVSKVPLESFGYDISNIKGIRANDSQFAFRLADESNHIPTTLNMQMPSSLNYYSVVSINKQTGLDTSITIAPTMPLVLGRIETNSSDTRFASENNAYIYTVNRNIPPGGFLHRLQPTSSGYYGPKETFKYHDYQELDKSTLYKTFTNSNALVTHQSIYNKLRPQNIMGSAPAYCIKGDGSATTFTSSPDLTPIEGSNAIDKAWNDKWGKYKGSDNVKFTPPMESPKVIHTNTGTNSLAISDWGTETTHVNGAKYLINTDPKAITYEILALGDVFPESMLRPNHIGSSLSSKSFNNYGLLLEGERQKGNDVNHSNYSGASKELVVTDTTYQTANITSSTITPDGLKRFGIMRLVETTFDWHFNPVDAESMPSPSSIPKIPNFKYLRWNNSGTSGEFADIDRDLVVEKDEGILKILAKDGTSSSAITVQPESCFYRASNGQLMAVYKGTSAVTLTGSTDGNWVGGDWNLYADMDGTSTTGVRSYIIQREKNPTSGTTTHNFAGVFPWDMYADRKGGIKELGEHDFHMLNMYLARGEIDKSYLQFQDRLANGSDKFKAHNLWLPIFSGTASSVGGNTDSKNLFSAYHDIENWEDGNDWVSTPHYTHSSRVLAALNHETRDTTVDYWDKIHHYKMGDGHPYTNCKVVFKRTKDIISGINGQLGVTSAPISLESQATYNAFSGTDTDQDQHSRNVFIKRAGLDLAIMGTRTANRILNAYDDTTYTEGDHHVDANSNDGGMLFSSQTYFKPYFDLSDITTSSITSKGMQSNASNPTELLFEMNDNSTHNWLAFMPNLEGYYVVSNKCDEGILPTAAGTQLNESTLLYPVVTIDVVSTAGFPDSGTILIDGYYNNNNGNKYFEGWEEVSYTGKTSTSFTGCTRNVQGATYKHTTGGHAVSAQWIHADDADVQGVSSIKSGTPKYIGKITGHTVSSSGNGYTNRTNHTLTLDTPIVFANHDYTFRLMRISDTTFDDTPEKIEFNKMFDTGLDYSIETDNLMTGVPGGQDVYQENIYAMYLALSTDVMNSNGFIDRRTFTKANDIISDGEYYVTDGDSGKTVSISKDYTAASGLTLNFSGKLSGNGIVSFGETFTINTPAEIKLNPKRVYIGNTVAIGTDVNTAITEILHENDIEVDSSQRSLSYTNNIVQSAQIQGVNSTITLKANANSKIAAGDIIYNQDGRLLGKIDSISNTIINLEDNDSGGDDLYHTPVVNDEITVYPKKPFVLNTKFTESDVFSAVNFLANKSGLDYQYKNNKVNIKQKTDKAGLRKFSLRYKDGSNLLSVDSNTTLFDKANKIVVIGDNIKATAKIPQTKNQKTITHIDANIKTLKEAKVKAEQLLELHNSPTKKITLSMEKTGFELMKPGDIITLNFPNHNIPPDDYIVFEIENAMSSVAKITVGTFSKSIAERLGELSLTQKTGLSNILTKDLAIETTSQYNFEQFSIVEESLKYQITTASGTTMGFTTLLGFSSTMGIGADATTTTEIAL